MSTAFFQMLRREGQREMLHLRLAFCFITRSQPMREGRGFPTDRALVTCRSARHAGQAKSLENPCRAL